jgi:hypothetical protein
VRRRVRGSLANDVCLSVDEMSGVYRIVQDENSCDVP